MSDIAPIGRPNPASLNGGSAPLGRAYGDAARPARGSDRVEFSEAAQYLSRLNDLPDVREHLVARVRAEIQAGTYETDAKISTAVDNLIDDLA